jgi:hypothetical protein
MQQSNGGTTFFALSIVSGVGPAHGGKSKPALVQRASVLVATLSFCMFCPLGRAVAQQGHDFTNCEGDFALCAASTCQPTGGSITVNVTGAGTATFPEYKCTCPIFNGPSIADLNGGNMHGSCTPPHDQIWSTYQPRLQIPQAITNWSRLPSKSFAPPQVCGADLKQGDQLVNCFSFACEPAGQIRGVPVATCHCPLGESLEGKPVEQHTAFATQAGQGNPKICFDHPVSGPLPTPQ